MLSSNFLCFQTYGWMFELMSPGWYESRWRTASLLHICVHPCLQDRVVLGGGETVKLKTMFEVWGALHGL